MVLAHIRKQGFWKVVTTTGIKGLYFGWTATLYRDITFNAIMLTTREISIHEWKKIYEGEPDAWTRTALGLIPGTLASAVACPYDVVKTRMQGDELGECIRHCCELLRKLAYLYPVLVITIVNEGMPYLANSSMCWNL